MRLILLNMKKTFILYLLLLIANIGIYAQTENSNISKKEIKGKLCYEYVAEVGDGLYSIARKFNVSQADIESYNENISSNIKVGQVIYIPIKDEDEDEVKDNNNKLTHTVAKKETLYGISRMHKIPIDEIKRLNPQISNGIKAGDILIIEENKSETKSIETKKIETKKSQDLPIDTTNVKMHLVKRRETMYAISQQYNIAIHDLLKFNPEVEEKGLKAGKHIYLEMPKESDTTTIITKENNIIPVENNTDTLSYENDTTIYNIAKNVKIAYLLPFMSGTVDPNNSAKKFIEFYHGALLALNKAREYGVSSDVYTYDIQKDTTLLDSILDLPIMKEMDIIVGPAYSNQIDRVARFTKENNIVNISPFSPSENNDNFHNLYLQFNPHRNDLFKEIFENSNSSTKFKYILGRFNNCKNKGNQFVDELEKQFTTNNIQYTEIDLTTIEVDSLINIIGNDTTMLVFGSSAPADVDIILSNIKDKQPENLFIWGFEEWESLVKTLPRTYYYSLFNAKIEEEYINNYTKYFGKNDHNEIIKYDLLGYDITTLALLGINKNNNGEIVFEPNTDSLYQQSTPEFEFVDNRYLHLSYFLFYWNGYENIVITEMEK